VATVTLNRPDKLNAWTRTMDAEVRSAMQAAAGDPGVRAIVVTGAGRGFCAGADMNLLSGLSSGAVPRHPAQHAGDAIPAVGAAANYEASFGYLQRLGKPVVAAINGPVAGIGLCFTLYCDIRLMADNAKLTTSFARRGLIAEHGISWWLSRLIGTMNAMDLLLSARTVHASEAAQMGLVKLVAADGFAEAAQAYAEALAQLSSPRSMAVMKRQVFEANFQSLGEAVQIADAEMLKSFASEDFKEGVAHFVEKREPRFTGR
jgi:enoyl-CoA hydratase/carnithine racemase